MELKTHLMNAHGRLACERNISRGADVACLMVDQWRAVPIEKRCKICQRAFQNGAHSAEGKSQ